MHSLFIIRCIFIFLDHFDYDLLHGEYVLKEYVISVIGIVIISAVLVVIIPEGKTSGMIRGIAKTACVAVIIAPIIQFFQAGEVPSFFYKNSQEIFSQSGIETDEKFIQYYSEMRIMETQEKLQKELQEKYGVHTQVALDWEWRASTENKNYTNEIYITKIYVCGMENQADIMKNEVREYLLKSYCSEVQIE